MDSSSSSTPGALAELEPDLRYGRAPPTEDSVSGEGNKGRTMASADHILTLSCPNRPGIVAMVATVLYERGANILDAQQFDDTETGNFFMRVVFDAAKLPIDIAKVRPRIAAIGPSPSMFWSQRSPHGFQ